MRSPPLLAAAALLLVAFPASAKDPPEKLREVILGAAFQDETRLKAAADLAREDPGMLGDALVALGEKDKDPRNLSFLVKYTCVEEVRHFRALAAWAAWQTQPEGAVEAYLARSGGEDEKESMRAVEAAGLIVPVLKEKQRSKAPYDRFLEIARGERVLEGIEAVRAVNRSMDRRLLRDMTEAVCTAADDHVRKHLVWALIDLQGERATEKSLEGLKRRPGDQGKNAAEGVNILLDQQSTEFAWNPQALAGVDDWWKKGRPPGGKVDVAIGDKLTMEKVRTWVAELEKNAPAWGSLVHAALHQVALRTRQQPEIFDLKKKALLIDASEIARCETEWQGAYVLARDACIAFSAHLGEPATGHRGWEQAYAEIHSFMKTTRRSAGKHLEYVDEQVRKKPWP